MIFIWTPVDTYKNKRYSRIKVLNKLNKEKEISQ